MSSDKIKSHFLDIISHIDDIQLYVQGIAKADLQANKEKRHAIEHCICIIGEAATRLGDQTAAYAPGIPWTDIKRMRNRVIHDYGNVNIDIIWDTVQNDLQPLQNACMNAVKQIENKK